MLLITLSNFEVHTHIDLAHKILSHLYPHSNSNQCHHKNSHHRRTSNYIPPQLQEYTPFFNRSILTHHKKLKTKFHSLNTIKSDLVSINTGTSPNPFHIESSVFSSSFRMLQSEGSVSEIDPEILKLPAYINWAEQKKTTKIKYQGQCRSCYTFSGLASVESAILIK